MLSAIWKLPLNIQCTCMHSSVEFYCPLSWRLHACVLLLPKITPNLTQHRFFDGHRIWQHIMTIYLWLSINYTRGNHWMSNSVCLWHVIAYLTFAQKILHSADKINNRKQSLLCYLIINQINTTHFHCLPRVIITREIYKSLLHALVTVIDSSQ